MANDTPLGGSLLASSKTLLYNIEAREDFLLLSCKFPPKSEEIKYKDIVSVEHKRLVDHGNLKGIAIGVFLVFALLFAGPVRGVIEQLTLELGNATGFLKSTTIDYAVKSAAEKTTIILAGFFTIVTSYYVMKLLSSFKYKLVVYRTGRVPISVPMNLTGSSIDLLAKINQQVKKAAGVSKDEVERIVSERLRPLIEKRTKMQREMFEALRTKALVVKTAKQREELKKMAEASIQKLEEQDDLIIQELKTYGLSKDEIFRKYRIKPPKEEFIDAVLDSEDMKDLLK